MKSSTLMTIIIVGLVLLWLYKQNLFKTQVVTNSVTKQDNTIPVTTNLRADVATAQDYLQSGVNKVGSIWTPNPVVKGDGTGSVITHEDLPQAIVTTPTLPPSTPIGVSSLPPVALPDWSWTFDGPAVLWRMNGNYFWGGLDTKKIPTPVMTQNDVSVVNSLRSGGATTGYFPSAGQIPGWSI